jgi:hypothetical protein
MRSVLKKSVAVLGGTFLALLIGELLAPVSMNRRAADKTEYITNALGFRLGDPERIKVPGTVRIAFIGDSYTFGRGVEFSRIFSERTPDLIRTERPGMTVEALNFGHPGFNSSRELETLKNIALTYEPDVLVLAFVLNDFSGPIETLKYERKVQKLTSRYALLRKLHRHSRLAAFLDWGIYQMFSGIGKVQLDYLNGLFDPEKNKELPKERAALEEMIRIIRERKGIVLFLPYFVRDEEKQEFYIKGRALVGGLCQTLGVPFVEILPLLRSRAYSRWWVSQVDHHPNAEGHAIIARALADAILKNKIL